MIFRIQRGLQFSHFCLLFPASGAIGLLRLSLGTTTLAEFLADPDWLHILRLGRATVHAANVRNHVHRLVDEPGDCT